MVYTPVIIPDETIPELGQKIRATFGTVLFELRFDPDLIGGCALVWKGVYKDYSLRAKIAEKHKEILEGFKSFLK